MAFLLRHHPEAGGLTLDDAGWTDVAALAGALQKLTRDPDVGPADIVALVESDRKGRYAMEGDRIRAVEGHTFGHAALEGLADEPGSGPDARAESGHGADPDGDQGSEGLPATAAELEQWTDVPAEDDAEVAAEAEPPRPRGTGARREAPREAPRPKADGPAPPDVLYLGTSARGREQVLAAGANAHKARRVLLVSSEARAWKLARRQRGERPCVLYVDARRAHRGGVRFRRVNGTDFEVEHLPRRYVLNARADFRFQLSAGTVLWRGEPGSPEVALIRVARDAGGSWELPKGKLQRDERPLQAALRETREELGLPEDATLHAGASLGEIHYAFHIPGGRPRLKTVVYFLARLEEPDRVLAPRTEEHIEEVRWFPLDEALSVVTHENVRQTLQRAAEALSSGGGSSPAEVPGEAPRDRPRRRRRRGGRGGRGTGHGARPRAADEPTTADSAPSSRGSTSGRGPGQGAAPVDEAAVVAAPAPPDDPA